MEGDRPIRVLYIEDDRGLARLTERALKSEAIEVDTAETGQDGLNLYHQNEYDLVLVDYRMPGMTGIEVIQEINKEEEPRPVIMVTGGGSENIAVQAMKLGASDYIVKDIDSGYLELVPMVIEQVMRRHQLIREKKEAEEAKEQLIRELDAFAHTVAHDLKNPLYSVRLNLDQLKSLPQQDMGDMVGGLKGSLDKMGNIIDELLLLATVRIEEVQFEALDMHSIVQDALERLDYLVQDRNAEINIPDHFPQSMGHGPWVEEVWANYLSNALKYGGDPPVIEVGYTDSGDDHITYWVKDNGAGISPEDQKRLFISFGQLGDHGVSGHGLGLTIVQRIMEKLGGTRPWKVPREKAVYSPLACLKPSPFS